MSRQHIAIRRQERQKALAKIMYSALDAGDDRVLVKKIFYMFSPALCMDRLSRLHHFLHTLPLTIDSEGQGRARRSTIRMDANALCFIADKLGMELVDLLKKVEPRKPKAGYMPLDEFVELRDSIPEFAPMGDPVFQLTSAPRL